MAGNNNTSGKRVVRAFLLSGVIVLLAGIFIPQEWSPHARPVEILTGLIILFGSIAGLYLG